MKNTRYITLGWLYIYAAVMSFIIAVGDQRDQLHFAHETGLDVSTGTMDRHLMLSFFLGYVVRFTLLVGLAAFIAGGRKFTQIVKYALAASVFFEVVLIWLSFSPAQPKSSGPFANNGWFALLAVAVFSVSCVAQLIGMIVGAVKGRST